MPTKRISKTELKQVETFSKRFRQSRMDPREEREDNDAILRALEPRLAKYEEPARTPRDRFNRRGTAA